MPLSGRDVAPELLTRDQGVAVGDAALGHVDDADVAPRAGVELGERVAPVSNGVALVGAVALVSGIGAGHAGTTDDGRCYCRTGSDCFELVHWTLSLGCLLGLITNASSPVVVDDCARLLAEEVRWTGRRR
jgi:hypothetical protein